MSRDIASLARRFHDGDIVDVYFESRDGSTGVERVDFGGVETHEGAAAIVRYFVRADLTCDWIELDDVADIRLVRPWTERPAAELLTNTVGAGSRPASKSSLALNGRRFRTRRAMTVSPVSGGGPPGDRGARVEIPAGTIVTVTLADPEATRFVLELAEEKYAFVLEAHAFSELLEAI